MKSLGFLPITGSGSQQHIQDQCSKPSQKSTMRQSKCLPSPPIFPARNTYSLSDALGHRKPIQDLNKQLFYLGVQNYVSNQSQDSNSNEYYTKELPVIVLYRPDLLFWNNTIDKEIWVSIFPNCKTGGWREQFAIACETERWLDHMMQASLHKMPSGRKMTGREKGNQFDKEEVSC